MLKDEKTVEIDIIKQIDITQKIISEESVGLLPKKQEKSLVHDNKKIKKYLKRIIKHIKFLDKELITFKKYNNKKRILFDNLDLLIINFQETLSNLKRERDFLEQKQLDQKILIDKLKDQIKNN
ncbi:MAG: hypothetical protein KFW07_02130 [Mycoplasmataceae bacterium]|nr:hypothetical protein [Mycoplasmataceae bacterium]